MAEQPTKTAPGGLATQGSTNRAVNVQRVLKILEELAPLIASMDRLVKTEKKFEMMLFEPTLLFEYRRNYMAFLIAVELYKKHKEGTLQNEEANRSIEQVKLYDAELAEEIRKVLPIIDSKRGLFADLFDALRQGRQYFISYISTHLNELVARAKSLQEKKGEEKHSQRLVALFSSASGRELSYLTRYRTDAEHWPNYAVGYGIEFFINRLNLFLKGGAENNIQYMGLYKDFGDGELTKEIWNDPAVRNLWRYQGQVDYLNRLIGLCKKSEASGRWEGFYGKEGVEDKKGFWTDFDKYAGEFETKYGNVEFAAYLRSQKSKIGENPDAWGGVWQGNRLVKPGFLQELQDKLRLDRSYQIRRIIIPAASSLSRIFRERENKLRAEAEKLVDELIRLLQEIEGVGIGKEKVVLRFGKMLRKRKKVLLRNLSNDIAELTGIITAPLLEYSAVKEEQKRVLGKMTREYLAQVTDRLEKARNPHLEFMAKHLRTGRFLIDITDSASIGVAEGIAEELDARISAYGRFEHISEDDLRFLQNLIARVRKVITGLIDVYRFIRDKMRQRYVITIQALESLELDFEKRGNKSSELSYVKRYLERVI